MNFSLYLYKVNLGHVGCSSGFSSQIYKPYLPVGFNAQGREQTNALVEKISASLKQMNFSSFMNIMCVFYGLRNLKNKIFL